MTNTISILTTEFTITVLLIKFGDFEKTVGANFSGFSSYPERQLGAQHLRPILSDVHHVGTQEIN